MSAWHDNISPAALQRITTLSAFNDPKSKDLMLQTLYEELEKTIESLRKWNYPAKGEMPEDCSCVLCFLKDGGCETAYYESGEFTFCAPAYHAQDVTAWQELPEEPEHD